VKVNENIAPQSTAAVVASDLNEAVGEYYDNTIDLYESLWGEHVHHGYWDPGESPAANGVDRHRATDRLVRELAAFARVPAEARVLDVGCGIGGPAMYLARDLRCTVEGITLSAAQVARAREKAGATGVADRTRFRQLDFLANDYPDASFDALWAMESLMHIPDRPAFFAEAARLLRPGGTLAVSSWCRGDAELDEPGRDLLQRILRHQVMPSLSSIPEHERMCAAAGFADVRTADWSAAVANSWDPQFAQTLRSEHGRTYMMDLARDRGVDVLGFFYAGPLMTRGYETGVVRYGALRATAPGTGP
jgi:tocopherol O-methyltransferase